MSVPPVLRTDALQDVDDAEDHRVAGDEHAVARAAGRPRRAAGRPSSPVSAASPSRFPRAGNAGACAAGPARVAGGRRGRSRRRSPDRAQTRPATPPWRRVSATWMFADWPGRRRAGATMSWRRSAPAAAGCGAGASARVAGTQTAASAATAATTRRAMARRAPPVVVCIEPEATSSADACERRHRGKGERGAGALTPGVRGTYWAPWTQNAPRPSHPARGSARAGRTALAKEETARSASFLQRCWSPAPAPRRATMFNRT